MMNISVRLPFVQILGLIMVGLVHRIIAANLQEVGMYTEGQQSSPTGDCPRIVDNCALHLLCNLIT